MHFSLHECTMHYAPHALLNCVAWFSLLAYGNAARGVVPSEVLSHFAHTVGTVLVPTLANEIHGARPNRTASVKTAVATATRRQLDRRQVSPQDTGNPGAAAGIGPTPGVGGNAPNGPQQLPFPGQGFPYQYERNYQYRYPSYSQQIPQQSYYPGGVGGFGGQHLGNGLPLDPRYFQSQLLSHQHLAPIQPDGPKTLNANANANGSENLKENVNGNANSIQSLDANVDSKSSAQNRPFDGQDFSPKQAAVRGNGNVGGGNGPGLDPSNGNVRVNNRFSAIDYERIRQNYYSDPPINQQRNYFNFNEIPFSGGSPYRSPLSERYSNLDYNGGGGPAQGAGPNSDLRSGNGIGGLGNPYFGSFLGQGPYNSLAYNSLPGTGGASGNVNPGINAGGNAENFDNFDRGGPSNFRSPFGGGGGLQYPGDFNGAFYPGSPGGGGGRGFGEADSSLRASSSKETLSAASENSSRESREEEEDEEEEEEEDKERADRDKKVRFVDANEKHESSGGEKESGSQA